MSDRLWNLLADVLFAEHYTSIVLKRWGWYRRCFDIAVSVVTVTSVSQLLRETSSPLLWALITVIAQIVSVCVPGTNPFKKYQALCFYSASISRLKTETVSAWNGWYYNNELPDEQKIRLMEDRFLEEQRFFMGTEPLGSSRGFAYREASNLLKLDIAKYIKE